VIGLQNIYFHAIKSFDIENVSTSAVTEESFLLKCEVM
jgi:hypothetical protein